MELVGVERVGEADHLKEGLVQPQLTVSLKEYEGYVSQGTRSIYGGQDINRGRHRESRGTRTKHMVFRGH